MASSIETGATFSPGFEKDKRFLGDFSHQPEQRSILYLICFKGQQVAIGLEIGNQPPAVTINSLILPQT